MTRMSLRVSEVLLSTVNSEIFARILFSRIALKDIYSTLKIATRAWFTFISNPQNDFAISR